MIDLILIADLDAPRKQRHTAQRIFDRLVDEHQAVISYSTVRQYVTRSMRFSGLVVSLVSAPSIPVVRRGGGSGSVTAGLFLDALGAGLYAPIALVYFSSGRGIPLTDVGLALTLGSSISLALPLLVGRLSDVVGSRTVVLASLVIQAVAFAGFLFVDSFATLAVVAGVGAIGQRSFWSSLFSYIVDVAESTGQSEDLDVWYARISAWRTTGISLGAAAGALLASASSGQLMDVLIIANTVSFLIAAVFLAAAGARAPRPTRDAPRADRVEPGRWTIGRGYFLLILANIPLALASVLLGVQCP